ncbi:MAG: sigma-70 family RNA polymerase sigma factor [Synergistales bacterium]|jgi:RNA polymerase sigma factor (sigma-70 family)|nr:sigma-70 family RNA polymerase sigma factor [Synergistales bacterium]
MEREVVLGRFTPLVRALARRYAGPGVEFDDLVQEGYLALLRLLPRCRDEAALAGFLGRSLPRAVRDAAAKGWRMRRVTVDIDELAETLAAEPDFSPASLGLDPDEERLAALMVSGMSQKEAGRELGISQQAVSRRLKRLAERLK